MEKLFTLNQLKTRIYCCLTEICQEEYFNLGHICLEFAQRKCQAKYYNLVFRATVLKLKVGSAPFFIFIFLELKPQL